ncbi:MAG: hypothetical protein II826_04165 [Prevotella sp.]|nr:hypothetical protein [Prevotella sp.]
MFHPAKVVKKTDEAKLLRTFLFHSIVFPVFIANTRIKIWWHTHFLVSRFNNNIVSLVAKLRKVWEPAKKMAEIFARYRKKTMQRRNVSNLPRKAQEKRGQMQRKGRPNLTSLPPYAGDKCHLSRKFSSLNYSRQLNLTLRKPRAANAPQGPDSGSQPFQRLGNGGKWGGGVP